MDREMHKAHMALKYSIVDHPKLDAVYAFAWSLGGPLEEDDSLDKVEKHFARLVDLLTPITVIVDSHGGRGGRASIDLKVYEAVLADRNYWRALKDEREPVPLKLVCPNCGELHVDQPDPKNGWFNPPHRSHLCHGCGWTWRPADICTVGVASIKTCGQEDGPPDPPLLLLDDLSMEGE